MYDFNATSKVIIYMNAFKLPFINMDILLGNDKESVKLNVIHGVNWLLLKWTIRGQNNSDDPPLDLLKKLLSLILTDSIWFSLGSNGLD